MKSCSLLGKVRQFTCSFPQSIFVWPVVNSLPPRRVSPALSGKGTPIDRKPIRAGTDRDLVAPRARSTYLKMPQNVGDGERVIELGSQLRLGLSRTVLLTWDFSVQVKLAKTHTNPKLRIPFGYFDGDPTTSENFPWEIDAGGDRPRPCARANARARGAVPSNT